MKSTIIHISDLHFHTYPKNFHDLKSKRVLGMLNSIFRRARQFPIDRSKKLVEKISKMKWDHLVISGDLTQLSLESEFSLARETFDPLLKNNSRVTIIPGNHDRYVSETFSDDLFKKYFGVFFGKEEVHSLEINSDWVIIGWDSVHPNDWFTASGTVRRSTIIETEKIIRSFSKDKKFIIVNHYPLTFPIDWKFDHFHELYNLLPVQKWILRFPQIRLYLHGHIHKNWVHNLSRESDKELLLVNSAASSAKPFPGQRSSFHQIEIDGENLNINPIMLN